MEEYYRKRAQEYESVYYRDDPERQLEQRQLAEEMKQAVKGLKVLEVACGTGYWTQKASETARSILATDAVEEVVAIAKAKDYSCPVEFEKADAYSLPYKGYDAAIANFWISHVPKERLDNFLKGLHATLKPKGTLFMADNNFIEGIGGELLTKEGDRNTYKKRKLKDGTETEVLKNYFTKKELQQLFGEDAEIVYGRCFWAVTLKAGS
ncbi:class I SAM-dependent methyltransferase [Candidatus Woesearchaeota archaeon]|nr:class I SAM-dependent methyltransferase [Candidatus Woesearchaeota archaeon]